MKITYRIEHLPWQTHRLGNGERSECMFNTKKTMKRRLSAMLALVMGLSLCSGFGFSKNQTVFAASDTMTVAEMEVNAVAVSGGAVTGPAVDVPTGPAAVMYPILLDNAERNALCAYNSEGNEISEAAAGVEVTVTVTDEFLENHKVIGWMAAGLKEDGSIDWDNMLLDSYDEENSPTVCSFIMPACPVRVGIVFEEINDGIPGFTPDDSPVILPDVSVEEKDPDVVTEEDVFTKEERKLFDELKADAFVKEAQEKLEAFVEKVLKYLSEETKAVIKENMVFGKLPADDKTPAAGLKNDPLELFVKTLTLEERARAMKGETISLTTQAKDVTDMVSKAEKLLVDKAMKSIAAILNNGKSADDVREPKLGMFLDMSLIKKVGNDEPSVVEVTNGQLEVSIQVPAALQNKKTDVQRVYQVLFVADGETTLLETQYNAKTGELVMETDVFGTFALVYTDMPAK